MLLAAIPDLCAGPVSCTVVRWGGWSAVASPALCQGARGWPGGHQLCCPAHASSTGARVEMLGRAS